MTILMVESHYHANITDMLVDGATAALDKGGAEFERVSVPGALEIPAAIALAAIQADDARAAGKVMACGGGSEQLSDEDMDAALNRGVPMACGGSKQQLPDAVETLPAQKQAATALDAHP